MNNKDLELKSLYEVMMQFGLGFEQAEIMSNMTKEELTKEFIRLELDVNNIHENNIVYGDKQIAMFNNMWITCINGNRRKNDEPLTEDEKRRYKEYIVNYRTMHNLSRREVAKTFHIKESSLTRWEKELKGKTVTDARINDQQRLGR